MKNEVERESADETDYLSVVARMGYENRDGKLLPVDREFSLKFTQLAKETAERMKRWRKKQAEELRKIPA